MTKATTCGHGPYYAKDCCQSCYNANWAAVNRERRRESARAWREANADRHKEAQRKWREANAERKAQYAKDWAAANPERVDAKRKEWRAANRERSYEALKRWRAANPDKVAAQINRRRAAQRGLTADLTAEQWGEILVEFDGHCAYCDRDDLPLVMEHMTPLARGGHHAAANVVPACGPCNSRKNVKTAQEFAGWTIPPRRQLTWP